MEIYNFDQYSPEWWEIREKRMTASHAQAIGACGKGLYTYINKKISSYFSNAEPVAYKNKAMERGNELEDSAATLYSFEHGIDVKKIGFACYSDYVGASPDRLADKDGLAEIKCPEDHVYFQLLMDSKIDSKYIWQMQMQMLVCEKKWCDYVVYNPNFDKSLFVERVFPDKEKVAKLKDGFVAGGLLIRKLIDIYKVY